jgi:hypothetical protein
MMKKLEKGRDLLHYKYIVVVASKSGGAIST